MVFLWYIKVELVYWILIWLEAPPSSSDLIEGKDFKICQNDIYHPFYHVVQGRDLYILFDKAINNKMLNLYINQKITVPHQFASEIGIVGYDVMEDIQLQLPDVPRTKNIKAATAHKNLPPDIVDLFLTKYDSDAFCADLTSDEG